MSYSDKVTFDFTYKPREETDFKEIYPDLDEHEQLPVFVIDNRNNNNESDHDEIMEITNNDKHHVNLADLKAPVFKKIAPNKPKSNIRFNRQLLDYGFQNPAASTTTATPTPKPNTRSHPYIRPFQPVSLKSSAKSIEKLIEMKKNLVEYDMDEQDYLFLTNRNSDPKNVIKITPEVFEIMMTSLENQWDHLEYRMNSVISNSGGAATCANDLANGSSSSKLLTMGHNNAKYGNDDGIVPGSIYDQKCAICNDSDCDNANAIVFCDGCDIAVHQECYGVAFIPEGQWLCRKCMINKNRTTQCVFCPSTTGAFKQLDNSLWSHVICAMWINELYFANPIYMEPIEGIDGIPKSRWKLTCYICKQRVGACIQCSNRSCFQAYHVTCAKRAGLYMNMTQGVKGAIGNKLTLKTYCEKHDPDDADHDEAVILKGIERVRRYYRDTKLLNEQNARLSKVRKTANKLNIFKWNTESNTPIAPKMFSDVLVGILYKLKVENQISLPEESTNQVLDLNVLPNRSKLEIDQDLRSIADEMCRYWCLKRELKRGAPLIRKNNNLIATSSILYDSNSLKSGGVYDPKTKLKFAEMLVSDIDRLTNMSQGLLERQELNDEVNQLSFNAVDAVYFPFKQVIEGVLSRLNGKYDAQETLQSYKPKVDGVYSLHEITMKNSQYGYLSVDEFVLDLSNLQEATSKEHKPSSHIFKKMKNWMNDFRTKDLPSLKLFELQMDHGADDVDDGFPKVQRDGLNTDLEPVNYHTVLEENDLSELDEEEGDEIESPENRAIFEKFLHG
ncbi:NuA3 HAT complex component NTO1 [Candida viswanathii]|uniref:NuA3 HAT complex component NTO1 n=1 Tax=Candida viswanathii TaxID=5486 RepID=A0A367XWM9_9ASCO|nr:NuA3 HAT complex component NTO1 [Candida viswanathii]